MDVVILVFHLYDVPQNVSEMKISQSKLLFFQPVRETTLDQIIFFTGVTEYLMKKRF